MRAFVGVGVLSHHLCPFLACQDGLSFTLGCLSGLQTAVATSIKWDPQPQAHGSNVRAIRSLARSSSHHYRRGQVGDQGDQEWLRQRQSPTPLLGAGGEEDRKKERKREEGRKGKGRRRGHLTRLICDEDARGFSGRPCPAGIACRRARAQAQAQSRCFGDRFFSRGSASGRPEPEPVSPLPRIFRPSSAYAPASNPELPCRLDGSRSLLHDWPSELRHGGVGPDRLCTTDITAVTSSEWYRISALGVRVVVLPSTPTPRRHGFPCASIRCQ